jgi:hypothetical protein
MKVNNGDHMATRSRIGIMLPDESILSVYHHWDGYPEWLGRILKTHYNTREKASELIDGGDMSCCWTEDRWTTETIQLNPYVSEANTSTKEVEYGPQYYSQRGDDCPPRHDANKYDYLAEGEEYAYIFTLDDEWICYDRHQFEENTMPTIAEIPSAALAV